VTARTRSGRFQPRWLRSAALLVFLLTISCAASAADKDPLRPPDTSSPRATLQGFVAATDDAYSRMAGVFREYGKSDRLYPSRDERKNQMAALRDAPKAM
jgi:MscS family membrane protein